MKITAMTTMKKTIYSIFAAGVIALGLPGCSDNYNDVLEPLETTRTLTLDVESTDYDSNTGMLSLGASTSQTEVKVESNTRWMAEVADCDGGWCDISAFAGTGNGTFDISVRDNMQELRTCFVRVYKVDAEGNKDLDSSRQITVRQVASDVRLSPSSLEPFAAADPQTKEFSIVSNVAWTLTVTYEEGTISEFVTITPISGGMESTGNSTFTGNGDTRFNLSLQSNRTAASRKAYLTLSSSASEFTVEITQQASEYTFEVTPATNQIVPAEGGTIRFGVRALSDWTINCGATWITFQPSSGTASDVPVEVIATIQPNTTRAERPVEIKFAPTNADYKGETVMLNQQAFDFTFQFEMGHEIIGMSGGEVPYTINSRFNWELIIPTFCSGTTSGEGSVQTRSGQIRVESNPSNSVRTGEVTLSPLPTEFNGVLINPSDISLQPITLPFTQYGGQNAAVSVPWVLNDFTQTTATVQFNYVSPYFDITETGIILTREDDGNQREILGTIPAPKEGLVSIDLTGLQPATYYLVRSFVTDSRGQRVYGSVTVRFRTGGERPNESDNPTPEL